MATKKAPPKAAHTSVAGTPANVAPSPLTGAKSLAKLEELKANYARNANSVTRVASKVFLQQLVGRKLTWIQYCDLKIKAYTEHWTAKKTNPNANKIIKPLTDAQKVKKLAVMKKLEEQLKNMRLAVGDVPPETETSESNEMSETQEVIGDTTNEEVQSKVDSEDDEETE